MSKQFTFTISDAILKFIDEEGGRIKKRDIHKSRYKYLGNLAHEKLIAYPNENEVELTENGKNEIEYLKKFHERGFEKLRLRSMIKIHYNNRNKRPLYSKRHSKTETIERKTAGEIKASILKLLETKGKIKKEEVESHYLTFESMIEDDLVEPINESGFYKLSEHGKTWVRTYKSFRRKTYENIKL